MKEIQKSGDGVVYALICNNRKTRLESSSGGAFTVFSDIILHSGGVIVGAVFDEKMNVVHKIARTPDERDSMRGSKYVQSDAHAVWNEILDYLENDSYVMFTGTPCQVDALKALADIKGIRTDKLYTVDLICHGVPSPKINRELFSQLSGNGKKLVGYSYRSKKKGWHAHFEEAKYEGGIKESRRGWWLAYSNILLFEKYYTNRQCCCECPYCDTNRVSDLTIGDAWGIEKFAPEIDDNIGISLVLVNTEKGAQLMGHAEDGAKIYKFRLDDFMQPRLNKIPCPKPDKKEEFWDYYERNGYLKMLRKYAGYGMKGRLLYYTKVILRRIGVSKYLKQILRGRSQ